MAFREASVADAAFILSLRLDPSKNTYLAPTPNDVESQAAYMAGAAKDATQSYFIIEAGGSQVGTVRLSDARGFSFCWGSWILSHQAPKSSAVESTLMVYGLGLVLGFQSAHFEVRQGNRRIWEYHERLGAVRIGKTELDYLYSFPYDAIQSLFRRFSDRIPDGIAVDFLTDKQRFIVGAAEIEPASFRFQVSQPR